MKKTAILLAIFLLIISASSCGTPSADGTSVQNIRPESIGVMSINGLNGQIFISLARPSDGKCSVYYRTAGDGEYSALDSELILSEGSVLECHILGLSKGLYDVMIEEGEGDSLARVFYFGIDVADRDTSGYAHFGRTDGIGGYSSDGTLKDGARVVYISNANKNSVTLESGGRTYTGLSEILNGCGQIVEPLVIRVLDRISTNQWISADPGSRSEEPDDAENGYFEDRFSDEFGENIAGMPVSVFYSGTGTRYDFVTSADGIVYSGTSSGADSDGCRMNVISSEGAKDITIEGVGRNAGFFQAGLEFLESDSVEIRNLTFEGYPQDALRFSCSDIASSHGGYWIHGNTFLAGYNNWGTGEKNGGDPVEVSNATGVTVSYNRVQGTSKGLMFGEEEGGACMNVTVHHNLFRDVMQRIPFCMNSNIHLYNNYFRDCRRGASPRSETYMFLEANYYLGVDSPFSFSSYGGTSTVKSFGDVYKDGGDPRSVRIAENRTDPAGGSCMPDGKTDCSEFDTDPELFYFDEAGGRSDVVVLLDAADVPGFVETYSGAGVFARIDLK